MPKAEEVTMKRGKSSSGHSPLESKACSCGHSLPPPMPSPKPSVQMLQSPRETKEDDSPIPFITSPTPLENEVPRRDDPGEIFSVSLIKDPRSRSFGFSVSDGDNATENLGIFVNSVIEGSPADGLLRPYDRVLQVTHHVQYPKGTTHVYSYFESRGGKFDETCFFGLQYIIKRWLLGPVVNAQMVRQAKYFYKVHFGGMDVFNEQGWMHIVERHNGYLPVRIKAVPEGSVVGVRNVLFTVENTDPTVPWLTTWLETLLLQVWYPMTVCTSSRAQKQIIAESLLETSGSLDGLPFKLHDFGFRGCTSVESAAIGGAAHLVNFVGTDTIPGLQLCRKYYHSPMSGFSIPAAEHSTITSWQKSGESAAYLNMLEQFPVGLVSVVSDSYDIYNAVSCIWGDELKAYVMERADKGCLVIRPDSGDPTEVVLKVLNLLADKFPTTTNSNGYKVLPSYLRVMQGDGICLESLKEIIDGLKKEGWSVENVVFGTGGALLQKIDRDTQRCAYKCSRVTIDNEQHNVFKHPTTDVGKRSKKGRLTLEKQPDNSYVTIQEGRGDENKDELVCVYENGRLLVDYSLDEIRQRAEISLVRKFVNSNTAVKTSNNSTNGVARTPASNGRELRETSFR